MFFSFILKDEKNISFKKSSGNFLNHPSFKPLLVKLVLSHGRLLPTYIGTFIFDNLRQNLFKSSAKQKQTKKIKKANSFTVEDCSTSHRRCDKINV